MSGSSSMQPTLGAWAAPRADDHYMGPSSYLPPSSSSDRYGGGGLMGGMASDLGLRSSYAADPAPGRGLYGESSAARLQDVYSSRCACMASCVFNSLRAFKFL